MTKGIQAPDGGAPAVARVVVELSLDREFDYLIPVALRGRVPVGARVVVPFGRSEARGFVVGLAASARVDRLKEILRVEGEQPLLRESVLALARWMAAYYAAPVETAVRTALPGAVRRRGAGFRERLHVLPLPPASDPKALAELRRRAPAQARAVDVLLTDGSLFLQSLAFRARVSASTLRALEAAGFVRITARVQQRNPLGEATVLPTVAHRLMPEQEEACAVIRHSMDTLDPPVVLLFGVTGSGKTEVYLHCIDRALSRGRGAILLVPEIALTPQTVEHFRGRFGEQIAVLHSHLSEGERHDEWHRLHDGRARIAVGARSAVFAPVRDLGLIIVDEEHEPTYKQDEAPRYNARDVAVMRGRIEHCAVVLGSATPSLESYHNARAGKYGLSRLSHRVDHRRMPTVRVVDMRVETERAGRVHLFSRDLTEAIRSRLARAEQTILFLNRRGFSTALVCNRCGEVAQCPSCSVPLTFHRARRRLCCHLCGHQRPVPDRCPNEACRDPGFKYTGSGTERVEEVCGRLFPGARVERMDADSMSRKESYHRVLGDFRTGKIDILVGTQMIAKGLHFPNVTLVGVLSADTALHLPDFRAGERTFQLLTQVAGRAGRGDVVGEVLVQTYTPFHPAIQSARNLDFEGFAAQELEFRREMGYPPFTRLACLTVRGADEGKTAAALSAFAVCLRAALPTGVVMGDPAPAPIARARGLYRFQVMLRAPSAGKVSRCLKDVLASFKWPAGVVCAVDIDALALL